MKNEIREAGVVSYGIFLQSQISLFWKYSGYGLWDIFPLNVIPVCEKLAVFKQWTLAGTLLYNSSSLSIALVKILHMTTSSVTMNWCKSWKLRKCYDATKSSSQRSFRTRDRQKKDNTSLVSKSDARQLQIMSKEKRDNYVKHAFTKGGVDTMDLMTHTLSAQNGRQSVDLRSFFLCATF